MLDRRKIERLPVVCSGLIEPLEGGTSVPCLIRNYSVYGALLSVDNSAVVPDEFNLNIPQQQAVLRVRKRWCRPGHVGVEFLSVVKQGTATEAAPKITDIDSLKEENLRLKLILAELTLDIATLRKILGVDLQS